MNDWNFGRNIAGIKLLVELGMDYGVDEKKCLSGTGIKHSNLNDAAFIVTGEQELRVIRNIVTLLPGEQNLGLSAGQRYHFTTFGMLGFAMVSSPNLKIALELALRYFNLTFAFCQFSIEETEQEVRVKISADHLPAELRKFCLERDITALITIQRELLEVDSILVQTSLAIPTPSNPQPYIEFFGSRVGFNKKITLAHFDKNKMQQPIRQANPLTLQQCEDQCAKLIERYCSRIGLAARVRAKLINDIHMDMEKMAAMFFMTSRTLRRQLDEEGTSFIKLRDEVRCALAEEYLSALNLSVDETSHRLGYASSSSFIAAFRRMTGKTPLSFKRTNEGGV